ncbi:molybdate ABC transporter permease subunit [Streptomyces mobaraensis NBRC 13819 = DSM 40847]|uniref:Molybdenum transport system permease protein ModB n=1 Tax=Streptomyces mobaraensis (strain ATCC 29032 / DSM 40847 / JCM 4168 / NBRC 13819 / NCIMB 11159 / IPCR 16-22) TaxID=1223523 RepID=M3CEN3_STRM1|nr:ABC transporter permease [Streptomyces mobaraensis]EMF02552.1 Molybdenum transport system permease protein ModB [Streptomyces mobaraensis NBRC 13819 = DSM 40847]QTT75593.1 molybdate ABC transporter permease subunit [Streptomyces mobaraensis NBRC 13819 = DSM 40847]
MRGSAAGLRGRGRTPLALGVPAGLAVVFLLVPLAGVLARTPWGSLPSRVGSHEVRQALTLSLAVSGWALLLSLVLGVPLAWLLARVDFPGKALVRCLVMLPMVLPPTVAGVALLQGYGRRGVAGPWLEEWFGVTLPFSTAGAVVASAFVAMPFLVISLEGALAGLHPQYEETAVSLGAAPLRVFRTVTLPMVAPGLVAGAALCWARALGEFGATITFAGNLPGETQTLPLQVYLLLQDDPEGATAVSLLLLAIAAAVLLALRGRWLGGGGGTAARRGRGGAADVAGTTVPGAEARTAAGSSATVRSCAEGSSEVSSGTPPKEAKGVPRRPLPADARTDTRTECAETRTEGDARPGAVTRPGVDPAPGTGPGSCTDPDPGTDATPAAYPLYAHVTGATRAVLDVPPGTTVAVVGPNGAGKTTLLRALLGLTRRAAARPLDLGGGDLSAAPAHRRRIAWVPQDGALFPHLTALANTAYGLRAQGVPRAEARREARAGLDELGIGHLAHRRPHELSGGQAQRVALARALAARPRLLLMDEPLAALDQSAKASVRQALRRRLAGFGGVCLLVTHDPVEAVSLADRVLVLEDGGAVQYAAPDELARLPRSPWVARMLGHNAWPGKVTAEGTLRLDAGTELTAAAPPPEGATAALAVAGPEAVTLSASRPPEGGPERGNVWSGTVREVSAQGGRLRVLVGGGADGPDAVAELPPRAAAELRPVEGARVWVGVRAAAVTFVPL